MLNCCDKRIKASGTSSNSREDADFERVFPEMSTRVEVAEEEEEDVLVFEESDFELGLGERMTFSRY
jgi:hypothetical protein